MFNILAFLGVSGFLSGYGSTYISYNNYELVDLYFNNLMNKYGVVYDGFGEYEYRRNVFMDNYKKIMTHNSKNVGYKLGFNKFFDMTKDEFRAKYLSGYVGKNRVVKEYYINHSSVPDSWDWREHKVVNNVKDQQQCGSCWAFSATSAVESAYAIKYGKLFDLAEQELVDCDTNDNGCNGGLMDNAWQWLNSSGGYMMTKDYPYHGTDGECKLNTNKTVVKVLDYVDCNPHDEQTLLAALATQPVSVAINANVDTFMFYESGIFNDTTCDPSESSLDHGVILVGYTPDYYILRNSWGTVWGEDGYMRMARGNTCGVLDVPCFPVV